MLAIPHQAVRTDRGKKICYVAHDESLERREVKIGQDTTEMVEVIGGLHEGEMVALNPPGTLGHVEPFLGFDEWRTSRHNRARWRGCVSAMIRGHTVPNNLTL